MRAIFSLEGKTGCVPISLQQKKNSPFPLLVIIYAFTILTVLPSFALADEVIEGHYCYTYGDNESLIQARGITRSLAIRDAIESYSVFIQSVTKVKDFKLTDDLIKTISAGHLKEIKVLEHSENNRTICDTIQASINSKEFEHFIGGYLIDGKTKETDELYLFTLDLIKSLKHIQDSRQNEIDLDKLKSAFTLESPFDTIIIFEEELFKAKEKITKWSNSSNVIIRKIAEDYLEAIDLFISGSNEVDDIFNKCFLGERSREYCEVSEGMPFSQIFLGRRELINGIPQVTYLLTDREKYKSKEDLLKAMKNKEQIHFVISTNQIDSIVRYIDINFNKELTAIREGKSNVPLAAVLAYSIEKFISQRTVQSLEITK